jgi:hypothetical protein
MKATERKGATVKASHFTSHVQMWNAEGIMMGRITPEKAADLVNSGEYHVINDQAIEAGE